MASAAPSDRVFAGTIQARLGSGCLGPEEPEERQGLALVLGMLLGVAQVRGVVIETPEVTPPSSPANLEASDLGAPARWFTLAIATAGGVGFVPGAPGTCGSVVGVLVFAALAGLGLPLFLLTTAALTISASGLRTTPSGSSAKKTTGGS